MNVCSYLLRRSRFSQLLPCHWSAYPKGTRQSAEEKARTHERLVEIASARIREQGIEGPGVAEIMQAAGLTHGGFYKHFGSRDDLIAEAAEDAHAWRQRPRRSQRAVDASKRLVFRSDNRGWSHCRAL